MTLNKGSTHIMLNLTLTKLDTFVEHRGIYLRTTADVSVVVTNFKFDTTGSYLALPIGSLGTEYLVASYKPYIWSEKAEFMVIGVKDNTNIKVTFPNGTQFSRNINFLDAYQEAQGTMDLTGTVIIADKPVTVIAGAMCTYISERGCDMTLVQVLPDSFLNPDSRYIAPPFYPSSNATLLRVMNPGIFENKVCFTYNETTVCNSTQPRNMTDFTYSLDAIVVTSSEPVSSFVFSLADPFMIDIVSTNQYLSSYFIVIPDVYANYSNYLAIVIPTSEIGGLTFDGVVPTGFIDKFQVAKPLEDFSVYIYEISSGYHIFQHQNGVPFGLYSYGHLTWSNYGFPGGVILQKTDNSSKLNLAYDKRRNDMHD